MGATAVTELSAVKPSPLPSWLPLAGVLALATGVLGTVMLGLAAEAIGRVALPDVASGATIETLADGGHGYSIDEVAVRPAAEWTPLVGHFVRAGARERVWIRVVLPNRSDRLLAGIMGESAYYTDQLDFWTRDDAAGAGQVWRHERSGERIRNKPVWGRSAVITVYVPARSEKTYYLRAEDNNSIWLDLAWWPDREHYAEITLRMMLAEALYYGALFALFFYNAVLWLRLRFSDTGFYLGYLGSAGLFFFTLNGGFPLYITPVGSPAINLIAEASAGMSIVWVVQFARVFLDLAACAPRADRAARWLRNGVLILLPVVLATPWVLWVHCLIALTLAVHGTMLAMALIAWRAGVAHARFFGLAFGFLFAGLTPAVLSLVLNQPQHWAIMAFFAGSVMEMLLLSLAMADRFARIQREREATQERLAEEMAQRETLQEAYADELEVEVGERTKELQEANRDKDRMIAVIGHDLRAPLTALTMGAELAAGRADEALVFTEEAAQTGRQVLLLIEDLVLWAQLRAGSVHPGVHRVKDFATQVVALHQPLAAQRNVRLEVSVPETLRVTTDLVLAQTLVRNLVANAVRFARTRVVVEAVAVAEGVRVKVSDDGPGLPPEVSAALSGDEGDKARGETRAGGLGLRFCVEIGRALGLRLEVKTREGQGAEFGFTLPGADSRGPGEEKIS